MDVDDAFFTLNLFDYQPGLTAILKRGLELIKTIYSMNSNLPMVWLLPTMFIVDLLVAGMTCYFLFKLVFVFLEILYNYL